MSDRPNGRAPASDGRGGGTIAPSARQYRWLDRASKLLGVALIATGLHIGGGTPAGIGVAAAGVAAGLLTVLIDNQ
ncbi:hypothetical protein [Halobellus limi]|jgi:hypothetical protein|uniref:DUF8120 domain-containing protein n=1 Tax=Halobellus limi TaxID=699433 RepID=A0A1H5TEE5_9EURY|nr:hypothetical protein [Halobellus limi]QCC47343.1 hypothetical protein DV707_06535 [Halobellus limi]SEF60578.1 hypothetical protein SAMN04488133_0241 [Halobellus limi]